MKKTLRARRQRTPDGIMAFPSLQSSAAWRQGPSLAQRSRPQGPITTLTRTGPSISDHDVMSGVSASGTDGVGTFTVSRIATE
jgi:hypothetical protein